MLDPGQGGRTYALTDEVDGIGIFASWHTDEEVVGLDVAVDEGLFVDRLYTGNLRKGMSCCGNGRRNGAKASAAADRLIDEWR